MLGLTFFIDATSHEVAIDRNGGTSCTWSEAESFCLRQVEGRRVLAEVADAALNLILRDRLARVRVLSILRHIITSKFRHREEAASHVYRDEEAVRPLLLWNGTDIDGNSLS